MNNYRLLILIFIFGYFVSCHKEKTQNSGLSVNLNMDNEIEIIHNNKKYFDIALFESYNNPKAMYKYNDKSQIHKKIFFYQNGCIRKNYSFYNSEIEGEYYEYYNSSIIKVYAFYDSLNKKLYMREYDEFGREKKTEGSLLCYTRYKKVDSSLFFKFVIPPYCTNEIKYIEYDTLNNAVTDTMFANHIKDLYYKPNNINNRLDFYVYLIDMYEKDTTLQKYRFPVQDLILFTKHIEAGELSKVVW